MFKAPAALALSALLFAAAVPAAADAATFRGKTNQGRTASLVTGADGVPTWVRVSWRAPCNGRATRATGGTKFVAPFTAANADLVQDTGKSYRVRIKGGLRGRISTELSSGARATAGSGRSASRSCSRAAARSSTPARSSRCASR